MAKKARKTSKSKVRSKQASKTRVARKKAKTASAAKRKTAAPKKKASVKRTALAATQPAKGAVKKEYAALHKRALSIEKDLNSEDADRSKRAAAQWDAFLDDFAAWAKKYGIKLEERAIKHDDANDPTPYIHGANTHGCAGTIRGQGDNGAPYICHFKRHSILRGCIYTCGIDHNGAWAPIWD
jgi:hypothetical protein